MPARDSVFQVDAGIQFYNEEFFCFFFIYISDLIDALSLFVHRPFFLQHIPQTALPPLRFAFFLPADHFFKRFRRLHPFHYILDKIFYFYSFCFSHSFPHFCRTYFSVFCTGCLHPPFLSPAPFSNLRPYDLI